ncbi:hypothetical protein J3F83DRAFT_133376 [Trichoderma novae-zelandiae]
MGSNGDFWGRLSSPLSPLLRPMCLHPNRILLSWCLTGLALILVHHRYLLESPRQMVLYPLQIWLAFAFALQSSLAEAVLLLPISTTTAMIYLTSSQSSRRLELRELPRPIPGPG